MTAPRAVLKKAIVVAIDGPAGAGKSTVAKEVAQALGYALVDTGAIYRSVALLARERGVDWEDEVGLGLVVRTLAISFKFHEGVNRVFLAERDVTQEIRTSDISRGASLVSAHSSVRSGLLALQRHLAGQGSAVLEGRDIGTVVCPDAPVKFFLDASTVERARRRYEELISRGDNAVYEDVLQEICERDATDRQRSIAPLRAASDACILDSTQMAVEEVIANIVAAARRAAGAG